jgi:hypothetical protein
VAEIAIASALVSRHVICKVMTPHEGRIMTSRFTKEISVMTRTFPIMLAVALVGLSACASSAPPPSGAASSSEPVGEARRLAVVPFGETKFTMVSVKKVDAGRVLAEVAKWYPKAAALAPLAKEVQRGIDWLTDEGRSAGAALGVGGTSAGAAVADAFARTLLASGRFDQIQRLEREPTGEDRQQIDALVRVTVPALGVVLVREGKPDMMAAYADARAQVVVRPTGVVVWEHEEDVTHAERLPLQAFTGDGELARQELKEVLERAGQRLANEFLYARSAGR